MPFGEARTLGFNNQFLSRLLVANSIINKQGMFFYSGTPAANNMVESVGVATASTDRFGNAFLTGDTSYVNIGGSFVATQLIGASVTYYTAATEAGPWTQVAVLTYSATAGAFFINVAGGTAQVVVGNSGPLTGAKLEIQGQVQTTGLSNIIAAGGLQAVTGDILATAGNVNITAAGKGVVRTGETWHNASLAAGFAVGGTQPRFQLEAIGAGRVRLDGAVNLTATEAANTTMFTLPAGYLPANAHDYTTKSTLSGLNPGAGIMPATVHVTTSGQVQIAVNGVSGNFVVLDGITFPLD